MVQCGHIATQGGCGVESVGVRELKDRLAHYLRAVQRGEIVTVTVRRSPWPRTEAMCC